MAATATAGHYVPADPPVYVEGPIRAFAIATAFWGVVGFLVGVVIALQLAFPLLNLDLEWTSFGRLRPVHTSAMIFWAGLIVVFTAFAMVPFFLGLALVVPLIGHATWHAYKDLVAEA